MNKRALAVLLACFLTVFTSYSIRYGYGMLLPEMLPSLAISKTEAGVIYSSFFIAYTVCSPVLGLMADRYNIRLLLTLFSAILGIGTFLIAFSSSLLQASLSFVLVGIGSSACWAPVMVLAQRWSRSRRKGTTIAAVDVGSASGIAVTSATMPLIVNAHGWRMGWVSLGALASLMVVINFFMVRNYPSEQSDIRSPASDQHSREPARTVYKKLLCDARFWLIGMAYLLTGFSILIPFTFLSTYAVQEAAVPYESAARLITVIGVGAIVGKMALGPLSDRIGRIKTMVMAALLIAGGALGIACYQEFLMLIIFTAIFSLGYGAVWSLYAVSASDYFPRGFAGGIVGLWTVYLGVGSILSPMMAGWIADTTGTLSWSFVLATGGTVISLLLLLPLWSAPANR